MLVANAVEPLVWENTRRTYGIGARINQAARHDLNEDDSEREDIGGKVKLVAVDDLWTHVALRWLSVDASHTR